MREICRAEKRIYLASPHMGGRERHYVQSAFDSNWIAPLGPNVEAFEAGLSKQVDGFPVVALSSGTAAIHLALIHLGVGPGDLVLCQSFTFCASANPIKYIGAEPVFIGSEEDSWNASPDALESAVLALKKLGKKPKAFIVVHLYGTPAKMDELLSIASKYEIPVIEDAAESLGSRYKDRPTGSLAQFGVLSFNGNKIITTSGGGALVCPDMETAQKTKYLATQAREPAPFYLHTEVGYNYRLSNISAGIGCGQLEVLGERVSQKRTIYDRYRNHFEKDSRIEFLPHLEDNFENRWLSAITIESDFAKNLDVMEIVKFCESMNVECRPLWKPLHTQPVFADSLYFGDDTETRLFGRGLCLPSSSNMSKADQDFVSEVLTVALDAGGK